MRINNPMLSLVVPLFRQPSRRAVSAEQFPCDRHWRDVRHAPVVTSDALQREYRPLRTVLERYVCKWGPSQVCLTQQWSGRRVMFDGRWWRLDVVDNTLFLCRYLPHADELPTRSRTVWPVCIRTQSTTFGWRRDRNAAKVQRRHRFQCAPNSMVRISTTYLRFRWYSHPPDKCVCVSCCMSVSDRVNGGI